MSDSEELLGQALRMLSEVSAREAPGRMEFALVDAFRRERRARRMRRRTWAALAAVAAAACVTFALVWPRLAHIGPPAVVTWRVAPPSDAWIAGARRVNSTRSIRTAAGVAAPVHKPTYRPRSQRLAASSPFIPLPYGDENLVDDGATIVRVEMPRSALRAAGFAVAQDRAGDPVRADLLVGADGLAHAVRLVDFQ
jgi:hypothetical protein